MEQDSFRLGSPDALPQKKRGSEVRPLTTDERASFVILSLYLATFCIAAFVYWDSLVLKILGVTAASAGLFLFVAAFFNTEAPEKSDSINPLRSYLFSFFFVLLTLFLLRLVGGLITNFTASVVVMYTGLFVALIVFRKAMVQVVTVLLALVFLFVTFSNLNAVLSKRMDFKSAVRQCGNAIFRIGPIQDVANMLLAGSYITYLNRIDYRDVQINTLALKKVAKSGDDDLKKCMILLGFVSNNIQYISDPDDGLEHAKDPITTLIAGAGDCEDQALLLSSLLESVGVDTYMAFTDDHVFVLVRFKKKYENLKASPSVFIDGEPCYTLDPTDPGAKIGQTSAHPQDIKHIFDASKKTLVHFSLKPE